MIIPMIIFSLLKNVEIYTKQKSLSEKNSIKKSMIVLLK